METPTTAYRGSVQADPETAHLVAEGTQPAEFCGIPVDAIRRLGLAASDTCVLPYPYSAAVRGIQNILPFTGLIEVIATQPDRTEAVKEHLPEIKKAAAGFIPGLAAADRISRRIPPLRRRIDARVARAVLDNSPELQTKVAAQMPRVETEANFLASFENPRQQFVDEVGMLAERISSATMQAREARVSSGNRQMHETPKGLLGVAVRVVRSVTNFFGRLFGRSSRSSSRDNEVTAYDAGRGVAAVVQELSQPAPERDDLVLARRYLAPQLGRLQTVSPDHLALAAPEILGALYSVTGSDKIAELHQSIEKHPHELRFMTTLKRNYGRYNLDRMQRASRTLLPAMRDILPTTGEQVRLSFQQAMQLFGLEAANNTIVTDEISSQVSSRQPSTRQPLKVVLKRLFRPEPTQSPVTKEPSLYRQFREMSRANKLPRQPWGVVLRRLLTR
jgi:hypothetical protein